MKLFCKQVLSVFSFFFLVAAQADSSQTPNRIDEFLNGADLSQLICKLQQKGERLNAEIEALGGQSRPLQKTLGDCIKEQKVDLTAQYRRAQKDAKSAGLKKELKEYYVVALHALSGIEPKDDERVIDYERRLNAEQRAVDMQKARVEAER